MAQRKPKYTPQRRKRTRDHLETEDEGIEDVDITSESENEFGRQKDRGEGDKDQSEKSLKNFRKVSEKELLQGYKSQVVEAVTETAVEEAKDPECGLLHPPLAATKADSSFAFPPQDTLIQRQSFPRIRACPRSLSYCPQTEKVYVPLKRFAQGVEVFSVERKTRKYKSTARTAKLKPVKKFRKKLRGATEQHMTDGRIRVDDEQDRKQQGHSGAIWVVNAELENFLLTGGEDGRVVVWRKSNLERPFHTFTRRHKEGVLCLFAKEERVVSASSDRSIMIFQVSEDRGCAYVDTNFGHEMGITAMDGWGCERVVTVDEDTARVWKLLEDKHLVFRAPLERGPVQAKDPLHKVAVTGKTTFVVGTLNRGTMYHWSSGRRKPEQVFETGAGGVTTMRFRNEHLLVGCRRGEVQVYAMTERILTLIGVIPIPWVFTTGLDLMLDSKAGRQLVLLMTSSREASEGRWEVLKDNVRHPLNWKKQPDACRWMVSGTGEVEALRQGWEQLKEDEDGDWRATNALWALRFPFAASTKPDNAEPGFDEHLLPEHRCPALLPCGATNADCEATNADCEACVVSNENNEQAVPDSPCAASDVVMSTAASPVESAI